MSKLHLVKKIRLLGMKLAEINNNMIIEHVNNYLAKRENYKALSHLNKLLGNDPSNEQAWLYLGIVNRRIDKLNEAIKCFETAVELNSSLFEAWGLLTITHLDKENVKLAEKTMEKAVELNPNVEEVLFYRNNLIRVYRKFGPFF